MAERDGRDRAGFVPLWVMRRLTDPELRCYAVLSAFAPKKSRRVYLSRPRLIDEMQKLKDGKPTKPKERHARGLVQALLQKGVAFSDGFGPNGQPAFVLPLGEEEASARSEHGGAQAEPTDLFGVSETGTHSAGSGTHSAGSGTHSAGSGTLSAAHTDLLDQHSNQHRGSAIQGGSASPFKNPPRSVEEFCALPHGGGGSWGSYCRRRLPAYDGNGRPMLRERIEEALEHFERFPHLYRSPRSVLERLQAGIPGQSYSSLHGFWSRENEPPPVPDDIQPEPTKDRRHLSLPLSDPEWADPTAPCYETDADVAELLEAVRERVARSGGEG